MEYTDEIPISPGAMVSTGETHGEKDPCTWQHAWMPGSVPGSGVFDDDPDGFWQNPVVFLFRTCNPQKDLTAVNDFSAFFRRL